MVPRRARRSGRCFAPGVGRGGLGRCASRSARAADSLPLPVTKSDGPSLGGGVGDGQGRQSFQREDSSPLSAVGKT
jgi:hypothetical protein